MKNLIIALFLSLTVNAFCQNKVIGNFYDTYTNHEDVLDVKLQGWLLKLAAEYEDEEEKERILNDISFLRVLIMSEGNLVSQQSLKSLIKDIKKDSFAELMQIRNEGTRVEIFIREDGEEITDVFAVINDPGEGFILLSLEGRLRFSDLNNLNINVEGMEHLKDIPEKRKKGPRA